MMALVYVLHISHQAFVRFSFNPQGKKERGLDLLLILLRSYQYEKHDIFSSQCVYS